MGPLSQSSGGLANAGPGQEPLHVGRLEHDGVDPGGKGPVHGRGQSPGPCRGRKPWPRATAGRRPGSLGGPPKPRLSGLSSVWPDQVQQDHRPAEPPAGEHGEPVVPVDRLALDPAERFAAVGAGVLRLLLVGRIVGQPVGTRGRGPCGSRPPRPGPPHLLGPSRPPASASRRSASRTPATPASARVPGSRLDGLAPPHDHRAAHSEADLRLPARLDRRRAASRVVPSNCERAPPIVHRPAGTLRRIGTRQARTGRPARWRDRVLDDTAVRPAHRQVQRHHGLASAGPPRPADRTATVSATARTQLLRGRQSRSVLIGRGSTPNTRAVVADRSQSTGPSRPEGLLVRVEVVQAPASAGGVGRRQTAVSRTWCQSAWRVDVRVVHGHDVLRVRPAVDLQQRHLRLAGPFCGATGRGPRRPRPRRAPAPVRRASGRTAARRCRPPACWARPSCAACRVGRREGPSRAAWRADSSIVVCRRSARDRRPWRTPRWPLRPRPAAGTSGRSPPGPSRLTPPGGQLFLGHEPRRVAQARQGDQRLVRRRAEAHGRRADAGTGSWRTGCPTP